MTDHTPGPCGCLEPCGCLVETREFIRHRRYGYRIRYCPTHAAAPDLLAALEAYPDKWGVDDWESMRRAAIAKARGNDATS